jgi:polyisoprenyl-phosphate glycosyltransferase
MKLTIITPVYNDWESLDKLQTELLHQCINERITSIHLVVVNDASTRPPNTHLSKAHLQVTMLHLNINLGHQRAIAIGLAYVADECEPTDCVIVMDCDGEDNPGLVPLLFESCAATNFQNIIFAERTKRNEGLRFRTFYFIYKTIFKILTNNVINFGNFSCIPSGLLPRVIGIPSLWNHYSGSIIKSRIPYSTMQSERGKRYFGKSTMNLDNLILHGFSSISIYLDTVIIKIFKLTLLGLLAIFVGGLTITSIKIFTTLAIPGWATYALLALMNIAATLLVLSLLLLLIQLNQRSAAPTFVANYYRRFIHKID